MLALTATATPKVVDDIQDKLGFKEKNVFKMSFERKNLAYIVRKASDKEGEILHILKSVEGSAIVYVRSRKHSKDIAKMLNDNKLSATFYNAGLESTARDIRQKDWTEGKARIMVATNAFGMGIDKPDVRVVIHADCPDSIEAYFQEAGRAGRDGKKSYAVLLYNSNDKAKLERRISETFPDKDYIRSVYEHLAYFYQIAMGSGAGLRFEFNIDRFCMAFRHFPTVVNSSLNILTRAGYINYDSESDGKAQVKMLLGRDELYRLNFLSAEENNVITALLRHYGGLFADYCYIDESLIAQQAGLGRDQVYQVLKRLSERRILQFIPRKKIPHITYVQRREEMDRLVFSPEVYDYRKAEYTERIKAIINYATNSDVCRSRQLLRYFGEDRSQDCGQCDVCLLHNRKETDGKTLSDVCNRIFHFLSDGNSHLVTELSALDIPRELLEEAVQHLISEERVFVMDGKLTV